MIFLHTADRHIGESVSVLGKEAALQRHQDVLQRTMDLAYWVQKERNLPYVPPILEAGDPIHKRANPTSQELALLHNFVTRYDGYVHWILISGNHDMVAGPSSLDPFTHLSALGYQQYAGKLSTVKIVEFGPQVFVFNPDEHGRRFCVLAIPYGNNLHEAVKLLDPVWQPGDFWVAMAHLCLIGSQVDSGLLMEQGEQSLPDDPRIGYWALGDIHKCQRIPHSVPSFYCGSPVQHNFGEHLPKGVLVVDSNDPWNPQLIDLGLPTFVSCNENDSIPENAGFIRMVVTAETNLQDLDPRVVQTIPTVSSTSKELLAQVSMPEYSFSPLDGLEDYLRGTNLTEAQQLAAYKMAEELSLEPI